jgi:GT2 family glycosyltransferase
LIIVDDGFHDDTTDFIFDLYRQKKVSSIIMNAGLNMGVGTGMNRGFSIAKGDWLVKADADLMYKPEWLQKGIYILENDEIGMVGFFKYHHDPCKWQDKVIKELDDYTIVQDFVSSAFMIPRDVYESFGAFEEHSPAFAEDAVYKLRLQKDGLKLALTKDDMMENVGFGLGRTTLYTPESTMEKLETVKVHTEPLIFT